MERSSSYRYGEGQTGEGQVVQFTAPSDEFDVARDALQHFKRITIPVSGQINVEHGGYGRYSRYEIDQIDYGGGQNEVGGGYYEILNIKNPPDDRHPFVSHGYMNTGQDFTQFFAEWETVEAAKNHWDTAGRGRIVSLRTFEESETAEVPGLIRVVNSGYLSPWFYATGDASLVGDYVFPENLTHDPVYAFGRQFLVPEKSKNDFDKVVYTLKTCMGCVVEERQRPYDRYGRRSEIDAVSTYRAVQWHDGSVTPVYPETSSDFIPVPVAQGDTWVIEAQKKFNEMLAGQTMSFEVEFANGGKFVGKYVRPPEQPRPNVAGDYYMNVTLDNGEAIEGWVNNFEPTPELPTIAAYVESKLAKNGKVAVRIESVSKRTHKGAKKWPGVFHSSLQVKPNET